MRMLSRSTDRRINPTRRKSFRPGLIYLESRIALSIATPDTSSTWEEPDVATDAAGNSVVVFENSQHNHTAGDSDVYFQRIGSNGTPVGGAVRVNTYTLNEQGAAKVAMDSTGNFVVIWSGEGTGHGVAVWGQRYDHDGVALGGNFFIDDTNLFYDDMAVAMNASGSFAVTYLKFGGYGDEAVWAASYNASGTSASGLFRVNTSQYDATSPSVGIDDNGDFVVAYRSKTSFKGTAQYGVYAKVYPLSGNNGSPSSSTTVDFQSSTGSPSVPSVDMNASGNYAVTWIAPDNNSRPTVYAREFSLNSSPITAKLTVPSNPPVNNIAYVPRDPDIAIDDSGRFALTWGEVDPNGGSGGIVYVSTYTGVGSSLSTNTMIASPGGSNLDYPPAIAITPTGKFIVVYQATDPNLSQRRIYDHFGQV